MTRRPLESVARVTVAGAALVAGATAGAAWAPASTGGASMEAASSDRRDRRESADICSGLSSGETCRGNINFTKE
ncbi:hypothetical protein GRO01_01280 [Gluconobacter roseus NBRC 3990]|uniref:Uncharacterized protein n=1 Tax=Gluconobacter roseus NBRC 3990 TaxID=1307950 RepID=A0A4Y3LZX9_9PROT|nr:hypothetical protein GRO01_01280 [Gluconobacter roseus NBRC 3990]